MKEFVEFNWGKAGEGSSPIGFCLIARVNKGKLGRGSDGAGWDIGDEKVLNIGVGLIIYSSVRENENLECNPKGSQWTVCC